MSVPLVRSLLLVADDLDQRGYPNVGVLRRAARALLESAGREAVGRLDGCARCGGAVVQPGRGRPRKFCTTCSPRKNPENARVAA